MRKVTKLMGIGLLVLGLAACDSATKDTNAPAGSAAASVPTGQQVSLLDGKLTFTLPNGLADQSDKLTNQPTNVHIYADSTNQRAVIVIVADKAAGDWTPWPSAWKSSNTPAMPTCRSLPIKRLKLTARQCANWIP